MRLLEGMCWHKGRRPPHPRPWPLEAQSVGADGCALFGSWHVLAAALQAPSHLHVPPAPIPAPRLRPMTRPPAVSCG